MHEKRRFNTLLWKHNTFIRPHRIKKRMLTLEEANERLHNHFPSMKILIYRCANRSALVTCKNCNNTFETDNTIGAYMYGDRLECEKCKEIRIAGQYREILKPYKNLQYTGRELKGTASYCKYKCKICGYEDKVTVTQLKKKKFKGCPVCCEKEQAEYYNSYLNKHNCEYLETFYERSYTTPSVRFKCNVCEGVFSMFGFTATSKISDYSYCPRCEERQKFERLHKPIVEELKDSGFVYIGEKYISRYIPFLHLLCGNKFNYLVNSSGRTNNLCGKCSCTISRGKIREEDRELVKETLVMLRNIQAFKNAWLSHTPDALEKLNKGFIKTILEHIDGWINNYEEIIERYPDGNLAKVIENNPLYKKVEEVFYPIMEKVGFKR